ncbi:MAG TPA: glycosyltransferase family 2 protein, partial [Blastocatellia bacterium]
LLHYTKRNLSEHHRVLDEYATLAAEYHYKNNRRVRAVDLFALPVAAFIRTYILKQGFRDGVPGLIIAMFTAYSVFLKFAKVWERNNVKPSEPH